MEDDGSQESSLRARFVPVTTGIVSGEVAEVKEPALSGTVVTLGNHLLEDGAKVILPKSSSEPGKASDEPRATSDGSTQGGRP